MSHPHTECENCYEIIAWGFFESYMKKVAKNRASNLKRSLFRQLKDQYPWENNEIKVKRRILNLEMAYSKAGLLARPTISWLSAMVE